MQVSGCFRHVPVRFRHVPVKFIHVRVRFGHATVQACAVVTQVGI